METTKRDGKEETDTKGERRRRCGNRGMLIKMEMRRVEGRGIKEERERETNKREREKEIKDKIN